MILLSLGGGSSGCDGDTFSACSCHWFSWGYVVQRDGASFLTLGQRRGRKGFPSVSTCQSWQREEKRAGGYSCSCIIWEKLGYGDMAQRKGLALILGEMSKLTAAGARNRSFLLSAFPGALVWRLFGVSKRYVSVWMDGQKCLHVMCGPELSLKYVCSFWVELPLWEMQVLMSLIRYKWRWSVEMAIVINEKEKKSCWFSHVTAT